MIRWLWAGLVTRFEIRFGTGEGDVVGFLIFLLFYLSVTFYTPNLFGHPDNYIKANSMVTPTHIVPEWYFLPYYAILKSIPDKLGGAIAFAASMGF